MAGNRKIQSIDFINLKAKVKAEMLRRSYSGSVAAYGGTAYDYISPPTSDGPIRGEYLEKNLLPMQAVNGDGLPYYPSVLDQAGQEAMETKVAAWATRGITDRSATDCKSGCTGTCYSSCQTGCYSGCSSCSGCSGCSGCGSGCAGGCSGCGSGCSTSCSGGCSTGCGVECSGTCDTSCFSRCARTGP